MSKPNSFNGTKILVITSSYPFHTEDYHALFVHQMNQALLEVGATQITVLTPIVPHAPSEEILDQIHIKRFSYLGFRHDKENPTGDDGIVENVKRNPLLALKIPSLITSFFLHIRREAKKHDLIISHWLLPSTLLGSFCSKPHLAIAHGSDVALLSQLPARQLLLQFLLQHSQIHATSQFILDSLHAILPKPSPSHPLHLTPLGITPPPPHLLAKRKPLDGTFQLLFMGRILRSKGIAFLLDLLPHLEHCSLTFIGDGHELTWLHNEIRRRKLPAQALGPKLHREKTQILLQSHLFLFLPEENHRENLPISLIEALAHGIPLLALDKGAINEILQHEINGFLLKKRTLPQIVQIIQNLQKNPSRWQQLSQQAQLSVQHFLWPQRILDFQRKFFAHSSHTTK